MSYLERPILSELGSLWTSRMRYKTIIPYCIGKSVLDFGCGIGHGSYILSHFAARVVGYDKSSVIDEARTIFKRYNLSFTSDLANDSCDILCAVESIEHLEKDELNKLLDRFKDKVFVGTTPNGNYFHYQPMTVEQRRGFHVWHYTEDQLLDLFGRYYKFVLVTGCVMDPRIKVHTGYTILASNLAWDGSWDNREYNPLQSV